MQSYAILTLITLYTPIIITLKYQSIMTQQQFNQQHPTGEQLTMIHYDFETGRRTAQPAIITGTKADPKYPGDPEEFLVCVRFTTKDNRLTMDPVTFGMLSNIDNL